MGAWFPSFDPFGGLIELVKLGLVVVVLLVFGLALLSGKLNSNIPPPWSTALGLGCIGAVVWLLYNGGF